MKLNIALLAGGYSGESVISLKSASVIAQKINREKYNVYVININHNGWYWENEKERIEINRHDFTLEDSNKIVRFDVAFIMIHGTPGENGLLQGYFELLGIPHTTCNAMVSNLTFNKYYTNQLVKSFGVKTNASVYYNNEKTADPDEVVSKLKFPVFVKPNSGGSSIGMSKVKEEKHLTEALQKAFAEDHEVLVEEFTAGDELTCGVIRNKGHLQAFPVTLVRSKKEFFDYEAKYNEDLADEITPAPVPQNMIDDVTQISLLLYEKLNCKGVVRFDFIHNGTEPVFLEVNTVPGMSSASIIPQQARAAGINESELYDLLIDNALHS